MAFEQHGMLGSRGIEIGGRRQPLRKRFMVKGETQHELSCWQLSGLSGYALLNLGDGRNALEVKREMPNTRPQKMNMAVDKAWHNRLAMEIVDRHVGSVRHRGIKRHNVAIAHQQSRGAWLVWLEGVNVSIGDQEVAHRAIVAQPVNAATFRALKCRLGPADARPNPNDPLWVSFIPQDSRRAAALAAWARPRRACRRPF